MEYELITMACGWEHTALFCNQYFEVCKVKRSLGLQWFGEFEEIMSNNWKSSQSLTYKEIRLGWDGKWAVNFEKSKEIFVFSFYYIDIELKFIAKSRLQRNNNRNSSLLSIYYNNNNNNIALIHWKLAKQQSSSTTLLSLLDWSKKDKNIPMLLAPNTHIMSKVKKNSSFSW